MKRIAIIPARYGSSRLPAKALAELAGRPMIVHVVQRAAAMKVLDRVVVATDHPAIREAVEKAGFEAVMTGQHHPSGTDRIAEACEILHLHGSTLVVNIQGDQPLVEEDAVAAMIHLMEEDQGLSMATVACPLDADQVQDPNRVKVVLDAKGRALYFSRAPIPHFRDGSPISQGHLRHLGLYVYRRDFLSIFTSLPEGRLEAAEKLEQLRVLENGYRIGVAVVEKAPPEVDTAEDLEQVERIITGLKTGRT